MVVYVVTNIVILCIYGKIKYV